MSNYSVVRSSMLRLNLLCWISLAPLPGLPDGVAIVRAAQVGEDVEQRGLLQRIRETEAALSAGNWLEAVEEFDSAWALACEKEDPLMFAGGADVRQLAPGATESLAGGKANLESLFQNAPPEFRAEFTRQFSDLAEKQIADAIETGDLNEVRRVAVRHSFCPAARRGMMVLAKLAMDRGDFLEAALLLGRLERMNSEPDATLTLRIAYCYSRAGLVSDAVDLINRILSAPHPDALTLGGKSLQFPSTAAESGAWIRQHFGAREQESSDWLQPGGSYRRFARQALGPSRYSAAWKTDLFSVQDVLYAEQFNPILSEFSDPIEQEAVRLLQRNSVIVPAAVPLIKGDMAILRTPFGIRAVKIQSGELIWEVTRPESRFRVMVDEMTGEDRGNSRDNPRENGMFQTAQYVVPQIQLFYQLVRTNTAAQMAINGTTLFVCEESSAATWNDDYGYSISDATVAIPSNFIRAYDVETGLFKWEVGGQTQNSGQPAGRGNLLAGFYFLGSPLVLGERTYVLAENGEGIFLIQIGEPSAGDVDSNPRVLRSQLLTIPEGKLPGHPVRKHSGLVPSFAQGLLICPTCDERIVAVSAEDNAIRWIFRYAGNIRPQEIGGDDLVLFGARNLLDTRQVDLDSRWIDSLPRIVDSRVLVTPRDSDQLFCLDLISGRQLWKSPRGSFHAIGAVTPDRVVLVGNQNVAALRISDGSQIWSTEIRDGIVCGTAATNGDVLQIPTSESAIVTLDLETGQKLVRQHADFGKMPGNLLMTEHGVLSQNLTSVSFSKLENRELVAVDRATELLLERQHSNALELLNLEVEQQPKDLASRELLIEVLLEALRTDFQKNRSYVARVRQLIELSSDDFEIAPLLHSMLGMNLPDAAVLSRQLQGRADQHLGDLAEIVAKGMDLSDSASADELSDSVGQLLAELPTARTHRVASGLLLRGKSSVLMAGIRRAVTGRSAAERSEIQNRLRTTVAGIAESLSADDSRLQFAWELAACGFPELALSIPETSSDETLTEQVRLCTELVRLEIGQSTSENAVPEVTALLNSWKLANDRSAIAAWIADISNPIDPNTRLRFQMRDAATRDAVVAEWQKDDFVQIGEANSLWSSVPAVTVSDDRTMLIPAKNPDQIPNTLIPMYGAPGVFRGWSFVRILPAGDVAAFDPNGIIQWTFKPPTLAEENRYASEITSCSMAFGHLLVINLDGTLFALDTSSVNEKGEPRELWRKDIQRLAPDSEADMYRDYVAATDRLPQYFPQPAGFFPVGPVTPLGIPVISGRRLMVLNPLTGTWIWQTDGIPRDAVILCSEDSVLVLSEASRHIEVRSLIDGTVRSVVRLPEWWGEANANVGSSIRDIEVEPGLDLLWRILVQGHACVLFRLTSGKSALESRDLLTDDVIWSIELPEDSVFSNVVDDVVAVLSDGRQLKLIQADTGRIIADVAVTGVAEPRALILRESQGHYIVLPEAVEDPSLELDPVLDAVHVYGRMYAIRRETMQLVWDEPLDHRHIRLMLCERSAALPNAPILVLLSRAGQVNPQSPVRRTHYGVRVVDIHTGKDLYTNDDVGTTLNKHWLYLDAVKKQLQLSFERRIVTLDYSGPDAARTDP